MCRWASVSPLSQGDTTLTRQRLRSFKACMLCLADRNFYGWELWNAARDTDADLL